MLKMLYNLEKEQVKEIIKSPKIGEIFLPGGVWHKCAAIVEKEGCFYQKTGGTVTSSHSTPSSSSAHPRRHQYVLISATHLLPITEKD